MKHDASFGLLTGGDIGTSSFKAGDVIFREGDNAIDLFVIKSGQVRIQIGNRTVTELAPDTIFGEMALIDDEPRSATAIAVTDVELVPVSEKQFLFLVSQTPYFALKVMRVLANRLRETNKSLG
jgi:CRP/FNR family cyclic AMP-dependent transcriptional regulator